MLEIDEYVWTGDGVERKEEKTKDLLSNIGLELKLKIIEFKEWNFQ